MNNDRYLRHSLIDWFPQDKIRDAKIAIVGCGAVGNEVAKNLALLGVGHLDLYDFDKIEIHNLTRSVLFDESDIGKYKSETAALKIRKIDPNITVNSYIGDFWDTMSFSKASTYNCIVCCVDNFEARIKLNELCLINKINLINTGIDSKFCQIELFPFSQEKETSCFECNLPNSAYERMQKRYSCGWLKKVSYIEKKIPTTIITSSLTGALAASKALNLIKGEIPEHAQRILIDSFTGLSTINIIQKNNECPTCSSFSDSIHVIQAAPQIKSSLTTLDDYKEEQIITSEPIIISYRCHNCDPSPLDSKIVFKKASDFDSTLSICEKCGEDGVDVNINDTFTLSELNEKYGHLEFPCKYIHYKFEEQSIIIEME